MSVSLITSADIPVISRTGTLTGGATDSGTGMNLAISGNHGNTAGPGSFGIGFNFANRTGISSGSPGGAYKVGGDVDFNSIVTSIPSAARITKIEIVADILYSFSSTGTAVFTLGSGTFDGLVQAGIVAFLSIPNTAFTPTTNASINNVNADINGAPAASLNLSTSASNAGTFLNKIWDIANDLGQFPLGYITRAQLVAQFNTQEVKMTTCVSLSNLSIITEAGGSLEVFTDNFLVTVTTNNWLMTIHWELPFSWTLHQPTNPIQAGDHVFATSDPLNPIPPLDFSQVTGVTLVSPSGTITVITFTGTTNLLDMTMPTLTGNPEIVDVVITSTQFSGSVILGKLVTIFFLNATGIYTLVPGKLNDTIYDNGNPGETVDVKIPNPFFKTGFIGG